MPGPIGSVSWAATPAQQRQRSLAVDQWGSSVLDRVDQWGQPWVDRWHFTGEWVVVYSREHNEDYFWNAITGESRWTKPVEAGSGPLHRIEEGAAGGKGAAEGGTGAEGGKGVEEGGKGAEGFNLEASFAAYKQGKSGQQKGHKGQRVQPVLTQRGSVLPPPQRQQQRPAPYAGRPAPYAVRPPPRRVPPPPPPTAAPTHVSSSSSSSAGPPPQTQIAPPKIPREPAGPPPKSTPRPVLRSAEVSNLIKGWEAQYAQGSGGQHAQWEPAPEGEGEGEGEGAAAAVAAGEGGGFSKLTAKHPDGSPRFDVNGRPIPAGSTSTGAPVKKRPASKSSAPASTLRVFPPRDEDDPDRWGFPPTPDWGLDVPKTPDGPNLPRN